MDQKIDFVITWVDGNDPEWKKAREKYSASRNEDGDEARFRDWGTLKYLFRGIEKFAPWVNKVHFITWGHLPSWLNVNHPKLNIVNHNDYIPEEYLPTFNSHVIEHNLFRINELEEKFVLFNDDMLLLNYIDSEMFYLNGIPRHPIWLTHIVPEPQKTMMPYVYLNNVSLINRHFKAIDSYENNKKMWESELLGENEKKQNKHFLKYDKFAGFRNEHLPVPILKSTMELIWEKEFEILDYTCRNKFRNIEDVSQYIYRYWQIVSGNCVPIKREELGIYKVIGKDEDVYKEIIAQNHPMMCINDMGEVSGDNEEMIIMDKITKSFEIILGDTSSFEIYN